MEIKAIIFDLDGVLVSTDELHYKAWSKLCSDEDIYFDHNINNKLRGISRIDCFNVITEGQKIKYSLKEKIELTNLKNEYYLNELKNLDKSNILSNVLETLKQLKERDIKLAVGSSSKNAKLILEKLDLLKYFDEIIDGNDITKSKPNSEVFLKASNNLKIKEENCLVVEDAISGIIAANNANMVSVAISDATKSNLADYNINNIIEILDII